MNILGWLCSSRLQSSMSELVRERTGQSISRVSCTYTKNNLT